MHKFSILLLTLLSVGALRAQSLDAFKQRLAVPLMSSGSLSTARVAVTEYGDAAKAVARATNATQRQRVRGYRVCIFFDNGQDARAGAFAAKALFESSYPGIKVYMPYDNPYFRVTVGNCLTAEEAIVLKNRVSGVFPKAFPKNEELLLSDFVN